MFVCEVRGGLNRSERGERDPAHRHELVLGAQIQLTQEIRVVANDLIQQQLVAVFAVVACDVWGGG